MEGLLQEQSVLGCRSFWGQHSDTGLGENRSSFALQDFDGFGNHHGRFTGDHQLTQRNTGLLMFNSRGWPFDA